MGCLPGICREDAVCPEGQFGHTEPKRGESWTPLFISCLQILSPQWNMLQIDPPWKQNYDMNLAFPWSCCDLQLAMILMDIIDITEGKRVCTRAPKPWWLVCLSALSRVPRKQRPLSGGVCMNEAPCSASSLVSLHSELAILFKRLVFIFPGGGSISQDALHHPQWHPGRCWPLRKKEIFHIGDQPPWLCNSSCFLNPLTNSKLSFCDRKIT